MYTTMCVWASKVGNSFIMVQNLIRETILRQLCIFFNIVQTTFFPLSCFLNVNKQPSIAGRKTYFFRYAPVKLRRARAFIPFFPFFTWEAISFKNIVFNFLSVCVPALDGIGVGV